MKLAYNFKYYLVLLRTKDVFNSVVNISNNFVQLDNSGCTCIFCFIEDHCTLWSSCHCKMGAVYF